MEWLDNIIKSAADALGLSKPPEEAVAPLDDADVAPLVDAPVEDLYAVKRAVIACIAGDGPLAVPPDPVAAAAPAPLVQRTLQGVDAVRRRQREALAPWPWHRVDTCHLYIDQPI
jgi:hypothetical protein